MTTKNGEFDDILPKTKIQANELNCSRQGYLPRGDSANFAKVANLTIFRQIPKFRQTSSRLRYQQSGEYSENGEFDNILPKTKIQANELKTGYQESGDSTNTAHFAKVANLTIFRQIPKFRQTSSRLRYQQSGEYDENGEFDNILPKTKIQTNELKTGVPTKRQIRRI